MTFCHGRRNVPRATLTMTKSHGLKIGWDILAYQIARAKDHLDLQGII